MLVQHVSNQFKLIFSEYGWPDTLVSDNGSCYTVEAFTNLMQGHQVNHITSSPHYLQSNGLAERFVQIVKNLFYKAKDKGTDIYNCLVIYRNMPLSSSLQSPMQMLQNRSARSQHPMSNVARRELGIAAEQIRMSSKNQNLPLHELCISQHVMYQDTFTKIWYPAVIDSLCPEPRSYKFKTEDGVLYRKTQAHLKPYKPQNKLCEAKSSQVKKSNMQMLANEHSVKNSNNLVQSRPKRCVRMSVKLDL